MTTTATRYELIATDPGGTRYLAGYVRIPSLRSAIKMLCQNGEAWVRTTGADQFQIEGKGRKGWTLHMGAWTVAYSGRTKLEAMASPLSLPWN